MAENTPDPDPKKPRPNSSGPPPVFTSVSEFSRGSEVNAKRYERLIQAFKSRYGTDPEFIARAPGRVNIIGEHIDYSGYAVLPMAIEQDVAIACRVKDTPTITVANTDPKYKEYQGSLDLDYDMDKHEWHNYILCGMIGIQDYCSIDQLVGMDMMVDGNIPPSAGLSSSSALVCCSALATAFANKIALPSKTSFAELCAKCERYVGTEGGGMDQAISFLGEQGKAMMIEFDPVRPTEVLIPDGHVFVIANTLVTAEKAAAASQFNVRVAECRLAALVIAQARGVIALGDTIRRLIQLQEASRLPLSRMMEPVSVALRSDPYTRRDLCNILDISKEWLQSEHLNRQTASVKEFQLYYRAEHVYKEADRVYQFKEIANAGGGDDTAVKLGKLMDESHASCRDLYECSCPELDEVVTIAKSGGSLGSRLTGAGWGGCVVSLVKEDKKEEVMKKLRDEYFAKVPGRSDNLEASLFVTKPGAGAAVCDLSKV